MVSTLFKIKYKFSNTNLKDFLFFVFTGLILATNCINNA